jgi:outer membrane protein assembly factor BamA
MDLAFLEIRSNFAQAITTRSALTKANEPLSFSRRESFYLRRRPQGRSAVLDHLTKPSSMVASSGWLVAIQEDPSAGLRSPGPGQVRLPTRTAAIPGVQRGWSGNGSGNGGRGKNNNHKGDFSGREPDSSGPRDYLLALALAMRALYARCNHPAAAHAASDGTEDNQEASTVQPGDQKQGPLHQVVVRGPVDRLLIPRKRLEQAVESILAANRGSDTAINYAAIRDAIHDLNAFYGEHGYVLANIRRAPETPIKDGVLVLESLEPQVARIIVQYVDANQELCQGRTRPYVVARALGYDGLAVNGPDPDERTHQGGNLRRRHPLRGRRCPTKRPFQWTQQHFRRLQQLGLFESISVDVRMIDPVRMKATTTTVDDTQEPVESCAEAGDVELTLTVRERPFHRFEPGVTFSRGKLYGDLTWEDTNVDGRGICFHADIRTKPDRSDDAISLAIQNPRLGAKEGGYQLRLFESRNTLVGSRRGAEVILLAPQLWPSHRIDKSSSSQSWLRPQTWRALLERWQQHWNIQTGMLYEQVRSFHPGALSSSALFGQPSEWAQREPSSRQQLRDGRSFTHLVLNSSAIRDTRPDPLHPQAGYRLALHAAYAVPITAKNPEYSRFGITGSLYRKIPPLRGVLRRVSKEPEQQSESKAVGEVLDGPPPRACLALLAEARISSVSLPDSERYALGGSATVRGMREGFLGQVGSFARTSVELRYPLDKRLMLVAFTDWGTEIGPMQHLRPFSWLQWPSRGRRLGTEQSTPQGRSTTSAADSQTAEQTSFAAVPASAASVGLGLRVLGALRMECAWVLDRGAGRRITDWRLSRDGYWHIGLIDVSF